MIIIFPTQIPSAWLNSSFAKNPAEGVVVVASFTNEMMWLNSGKGNKSGCVSGLVFPPSFVT